jgi:23S rRNA G2069 N7-methylase RlmK/C1962 C5-methylase RlmI
VKVPHFIELSASKIYRMTMVKPEIAIYLPDMA